MKKKLFTLITVLAVSFVMCSCGADNSGDLVVKTHQPTDDEQKIIGLLASAEADVAIVDYAASDDANCATIGYDLYEKGKLTKKNQNSLTGGLGTDKKSGMIGISFGDEGGLAAIYSDDESTAAASTDTPWKDDKDYNSVVKTAISEPVEVELDKKIYFFAHQECKKDETEAVTPNDIMKDPASLKDIDKAYVFYVIFKHSKEFEQ